MLKFRKPVILVAAVALVAVLCLGFAIKIINETRTPALFIESQKTYYLENPTQKEKYERLLSVTLYHDGTITLATPPISSYMLPKCTYSVVDDEVLVHATIVTEWDEEFLCAKNGEVIARFEFVDNETLVFQSATVPLFADDEARYVYAQSGPTVP